MDRRVRFTAKAGAEMGRDGLSKREVYESILNAGEFAKVIRSRSLEKGPRREYLYIIKSVTFDSSRFTPKAS